MIGICFRATRQPARNALDRFIGIEREAEYIEIARARIEAAQRQQTLDISLDA